jgi:hypothetical protein
MVPVRQVRMGITDAGSGMTTDVAARLQGRSISLHD